MDKHLVDDFHMEPSMSDPSLYFHFDGDRLIGINGTYVDDLLRCITKKFEEKSKLTYDKFETSDAEELPLTFAGINIQQKPDDSYALDLLFYHRKLEHLPAAAEFSEFRSMRMKLAWMINTRPDIAIDISQLAQVT